MKMKPVILSVALSLTLVACSSSNTLTKKVSSLPKAVSVAKNIDVIELSNKFKVHTFYGISNSHIIETPKSLILVDAQMMLPDAKKLKAYVKSLKKPLSKVIISHNHPDHWFGAQEFKDISKVVSSKNVQSNLPDASRYIKIMKKKLGNKIPNKVIKLDQTIELGKHNWDGLDVIISEHKDQESHNSIAINIPDYKIIIGQDLFYNKQFLVASDRGRNANWITILKEFIADEKNYNYFLVGHGKNGGVEILKSDVDYLNGLESILAKNISKKETKAELIKMFPKFEKQGLLDISLRNLFNKH